MGRFRAMLSATLLLLGANAAAAADEVVALVHDGRDRAALVHLPTPLPPGPRPLVLVLHGGGGNAAGAARMSGMNAIADREGFIVAYPNGSGRLRDRLLTWNAGNCCGYALEQRVDDVGFIAALLDELAKRHPIDRGRIFATGMSNGGMMAYRLGCELSGRLAAIAPVAGAMNVSCTPERPLSVIAFHGADDAHVRYAGGAPLKSWDRHPRSDRAVAETLAFWAGRDHCAAHERAEVAAGVTRDHWYDCAEGTEVELFTLRGFEHAWPGGTGNRLIGGDPTAPISASELMWQAFRRHSR